MVFIVLSHTSMKCSAECIAKHNTYHVQKERKRVEWKTGKILQDRMDRIHLYCQQNTVKEPSRTTGLYSFTLFGQQRSSWVFCHTTSVWEQQHQAPWSGLMHFSWQPWNTILLYFAFLLLRVYTSSLRTEVTPAIWILGNQTSSFQSRLFWVECQEVLAQRFFNELRIKPGILNLCVTVFIIWLVAQVLWHETQNDLTWNIFSYYQYINVVLLLLTKLDVFEFCLALTLLFIPTRD